MADAPKNPNPHPNAALDPDCTNPTALIAALEIRIAAEVYSEVLDFLKRHHPNATIDISTLLRDIEMIYEQVSSKHQAVRQLLTRGDENDT